MSPPVAVLSINRQAAGTRFEANAIFSGENRKRGAMLSFVFNSLSKKVLLCSPVTLYAVLSLIRQSVSNFSMEQKASEVQQLMGVFRKQWNEFLLQMDKLGNTIGTVQTHFEKLVSTRKNQLEKPMDKINDLQLGQLDDEEKLNE